ncbi:hypothetical protein ACRRTK_002706 [Alexandromys fortis]
MSHLQMKPLRKEIKKWNVRLRQRNLKLQDASDTSLLQPQNRDVSKEGKVGKVTDSYKAFCPPFIDLKVSSHDGKLNKRGGGSGFGYQKTKNAEKSKIFKHISKRTVPDYICLDLGPRWYASTCQPLSPLAARKVAKLGTVFTRNSWFQVLLRYALHMGIQGVELSLDSQNIYSPPAGMPLAVVVAIAGCIAIPSRTEEGPQDGLIQMDLLEGAVQAPTKLRSHNLGKHHYVQVLQVYHLVAGRDPI